MNKFSEMPLAEGLKKSLSKLEFESPTPIQQAVIAKSIEGQDIMACAETGSGKTAAYGVPIVERLIADPTAGALVLAPTRELVQQIADFLKKLTSCCQGVSVVTLVGGTDMKRQFNALKRKPRLIVATPGRLNDHLRRKSLKLKNTKILAIDEGDRMLDMGFAPQLDDILQHLPQKRQGLLFSATLPNKVQELARDYLQSPELIQVGRKSLPVKAIKQSIVELTNKQKKDRIVDELNKREGSIIIFTRTKTRTDELAKYLREFGFRVDSIHGGKTQGQRNRAIAKFKEQKSRILCATDVAARGIDVPSVAHVINYDLPRMDEDYVHRIGRTARNGADGEAVSFVTPSDQRAWMMLAKKYQIPGVELKNPIEPAAGGGRKRNRSGSGGPRRRARGGSGGRETRREDREDQKKSRSQQDRKRFSLKKSSSKTERQGKKKKSFSSSSKTSGGKKKFSSSRPSSKNKSHSRPGRNKKSSSRRRASQ